MDSKWHIRYLNLAKSVAEWSKDPSSQISAIAIGKKGQILSQGYNGFPRGILDSQERLLDKETKYRYVVHAEANCIYNATLNGISLEGSTFYVWGLPVCNECAKGLIQVGVKSIYWSAGSRDISDKWKESYKMTQEMLKEAKIPIINIQM